jgi:hypothetical protein
MYRRMGAHSAISGFVDCQTELDPVATLTAAADGLGRARTPVDANVPRQSRRMSAAGAVARVVAFLLMLAIVVIVVGTYLQPLALLAVKRLVGKQGDRAFNVDLQGIVSSAIEPHYVGRPGAVLFLKGPHKLRDFSRGINEDDLFELALFFVEVERSDELKLTGGYMPDTMFATRLVLFISFGVGVAILTSPCDAAHTCSGDIPHALPAVGMDIGRGTVT